MIRSFADEETALIWSGRRSRRLPFDMQATALRKPPGKRIEGLQGERAGQYSIRINDQWRICFMWREGGPADVQIVDYH